MHTNPLFQERLNRAHLMSLPLPQSARELRIAIVRNHAFEYVASALNVFLALSNLKAIFHYSEYDDSFSFSNLPPQADVCLLWVDASRYALPDIDAWLLSRIDALRGKTSARILTVCSGKADMRLPAQDAGLFLNADDVLAALGDDAWDFGREALTGTKLSNLACLHIARELGVRQIPALLFPPLKALVLDLDDTLYAGILGEDGPEAVKPYSELQSYLLALKQQGFILCIASRNEQEDVRDLFTRRTDFPLRWEDFAATAINWKPKVANIRRIAETLNIDMEAMLFVDDNPGEMLQASRTFPALHVLEAASPEQTLAALRYYPGLYKTSLTQEDTLRSDDIRANVERNRLQKEINSEDYLRELAIRLTFHINDLGHVERAAGLMNKTNQFILSFLRPSQSDVAAYAVSPDKCMLTLSLADRLSDSGVVAVALVGKKGATAQCDELVFSCRALGRGIENGAILHMFRLACEELGCGSALNISYTTGPRNKPALLWLQQAARADLRESGSIVLRKIPDLNLRGAVLSVRKH